LTARAIRKCIVGTPQGLLVRKLIELIMWVGMWKCQYHFIVPSVSALTALSN
jgi:hypothetical protein